MATKLTTGERLRRLAECTDDLRAAKDRLMRALGVMEEGRLDARLAARLGTIIGRLEDLQRKMRG